MYLYVTDVRRAMSFYSDAFDLTFIAYGDDWAECTLGDGTRFALHLTTGPDREPQTPGTTIVDFLADDLQMLRARLVSLGATTGEIGEAPTGRFFQFTDPDGYRIQVFQPTH